VSVDPPDISEKLRKRLDLPIRLVSDSEGTLMDPLGIRHDAGMPPSLVSGEVSKRLSSRDLFLATNYLTDEAGRIRWIFRPDTYRMRVSIDEILRAIDALGPAPASA
jgi:peroxiredoxin